MKLSVLVRKWHKWLALIVGVQLLFWTFSGLFMSAVPIEIIKSEHLLKEKSQQVLPSNITYFPVAKAISKIEGKESVVGVKLKNFLDEPTYVVRLSDDSNHLVNALSGELSSPITKELALKVATRRFNGDSSKVTVKLVTDKTSEYRGKYPVWQVNFNNIEDTTFYGCFILWIIETEQILTIGY